MAKQQRHHLTKSPLLLLLTTIVIIFFSSGFALSSSSSSSSSSSTNVVKALPGFLGPLPFHLETGYIGVGENEDVQLFYYFLSSERNPKEDPVLLWLTGGPGCSAFSGLAFEIGPISFHVEKYNGSLPTFVLNPYSWTKIASVIFLDSPVGTGFSYSRSLEGYMTGDFKSCDQTYEFLRKWLIANPEFASNPIYVGGDSYSGMTVPLIVQHISDGIEAGTEPSINLKGYLLGNPVTDPLQKNSVVPFAHGTGLISEELYESLKKSCAGEYTNVNPSNTLCLQNLDYLTECTSGLNQAHILESSCSRASPKPRNTALYRRSLIENFKELFDPKPSTLLDPPTPLPELRCRTYAYLLAYYWANDKSVREALGIREGTVEEWQRCNYGIPYKNNYPSSVPYHLGLSKRGYRSLIYSGDHDLLVPHIGTQAWIKSLNYSIADDWRSWSVDGQVGGYTRTYSNKMTFATVKGGGHTAPEYKPKECYAMFERWISNQGL